jgi:hypothetical protein
VTSSGTKFNRTIYAIVACITVAGIVAVIMLAAGEY